MTGNRQAPEDPLSPVTDEGDDAIGPPSTVDEARFRQVLGHFATGVTIVTTSVDGQPAGLSVNSFASVSLHPPLVLFAVTDQSSTWPRIREVGFFCVNVLADDQEDLSRAFAALTDMTITYLVDQYYSPDDELGVAWDDPTVGADWGVAEPVLSTRDQQNPRLDEIPHGARPLLGSTSEV